MRVTEPLRQCGRGRPLISRDRSGTVHQCLCSAPQRTHVGHRAKAEMCQPVIDALYQAASAPVEVVRSFSDNSAFPSAPSFQPVI